MVVLESVTPGEDPTGDIVAQVKPFAEVRAAIEPLTGRELFAAQQVAAQVTTRVTIRALQGVEPRMRVRWTRPGRPERLYDVQSVINFEERDREMHLMCIERR